MTLDQQNKRHAAQAARKIKHPEGGIGGVLGGIWSWVDGVTSSIGRFITGPLTAFGHAARIAFDQIGHLYVEYYKMLWRYATWLDRTELHWLEGLIRRNQQREDGRERRDFRYLVRLIYVTTQTAMQLAAGWVRREARRRRAGDQLAEARARREIRHLHQVIEREAASGYRIAYPARITLISRLLDLAVTRDPLLKDAVGVVTRGLLDFASIDDPLARWAVGLALRDVIDRLGVDKAIGTLASDLLAPLIGEPRPHGLHDVIADISQRLLAVEGQWSAFFHDGGAEVEQAGTDWAKITSLAGDAATLAFVTLAVSDPAGWARTITDTLGGVGDATVAAATDLIGKG